MMEVIPLASGSKGNSYLIRSGSSAILIDAGLSAKQLCLRLQDAGTDATKISAVFITHEHVDHLRGARVFARQFDTPVYINRSCYDAARELYQLDQIPDIRLFETGLSFDYQDYSIHPFSVSHDTADPVSFSISDGKNKLGIITDLGKVSTLVHTAAMKMDALILEANHDLLLLKQNPNYPEKVKQRIRSNRGHLSNEQSAEFARDLIMKGKLKQLILAHLSEQNNNAVCIRAAFDRIFGEAGLDLPFSCAEQYCISKGLKIG
ncbi:MAG: MBL fold metallo-hydrolase [bacterium]|jgi:phosphoribosyl 1,2-cyclic phosphodiesterase|nr:MBL fold metallo-hydrolase [bacterium]